jgi:integrase
MPVLFRTIYACGLRASEARLLRADDVDLDAGVLQIRDAKGGTDRQVPLSAPLRVRLADYHAHVAGRSGRNTPDWFFPGRAGQPLTLGNVDKNSESGSSSPHDPGHHKISDRTELRDRNPVKRGNYKIADSIHRSAAGSSSSSVR